MLDKGLWNAKNSRLLLIGDTGCDIPRWSGTSDRSYIELRRSSWYPVLPSGSLLDSLSSIQDCGLICAHRTPFREVFLIWLRPTQPFAQNESFITISIFVQR